MGVDARIRQLAFTQMVLGRHRVALLCFILPFARQVQRGDAGGSLVIFTGDAPCAI
jgi:hypothetical protein